MYGEVKEDMIDMSIVRDKKKEQTLFWGFHGSRPFFLLEFFFSRTTFLAIYVFLQGHFLTFLSRPLLITDFATIKD